MVCAQHVEDAFLFRVKVLLANSQKVTQTGDDSSEQPTIIVEDCSKIFVEPLKTIDEDSDSVSQDSDGEKRSGSSVDDGGDESGVSAKKKTVREKCPIVFTECPVCKEKIRGAGTKFVSHLDAHVLSNKIETCQTPIPGIEEITFECLLCTYRSCTKVEMRVSMTFFLNR